MPPDRSQNSHAFENMVEHVFLGQLLVEMWCRHSQVVEVSKADTDAWGYDVVLSVNSVTWYVQLKTSVPADVNVRLFEKQQACVVAAIPCVTSEGIELGYRFWNLADMDKLPLSKRSVYRRGQTERDDRKDHRRVAASLFEKEMPICDLATRLFPKERQRRR